MTETIAGRDEKTYLLVDGENIDGVLHNFPGFDKSNRARWDRLVRFAEKRSAGAVRGLFFLNVTHNTLPYPFLQALAASGFQPIPLVGSGIATEQVVDLGIQRTLDAIADRGSGHVLLVTHDHGYAPHTLRLLESGRRVAVAGFREMLSSDLARLIDQGLEFFDLEDDVQAFREPLNRVRKIMLSEFDPARYL